MVCGFDVHRDKSQKGKAIGGFVCSVNPTLTKWYSRVSYHSDRNELSGNLATNFSSNDFLLFFTICLQLISFRRSQALL